jgi:hypothetical protein
MAYSGSSSSYSSNPDAWKSSHPKPKKAYGAKASHSSSGGDFQRFLEYLDEAGRAQVFLNLSRAPKIRKREAL